MGRLVVVAYRPHEGKSGALLELIAGHVPRLRALGLATEREEVIMQSADGTVLEVFEWVGADAIARAHDSQDVQAMWAEFAQVCDYVPAAEVAEMSGLFSEFTPVN